MLLLLTACSEEKRTFLIPDGQYSRVLKNAKKINDVPAKWWELFADSELNSLIQAALENNPDMNQARKRLDAASALARKSYSSLLPSVSLSGGRENTKTDSTHVGDYSLSAAASYEIDMFGKNKYSYQQSLLSAQASLEDLRVAAITISSSIAENWLRLLALRSEEALLKEQLKTNEDILKLQRKRYLNGAASVLDILQQEEIIARVKSQLPDVRASKELVENQIAVLIGKSPSKKVEIAGEKIPEILPIPETGLPSRLLQERPDLEAAWLRVRSSDWGIVAAKRDRFPSISLSGGYSYSESALESLFDSWVLNLAAGVVVPIIDGGNRKAEVERQKALAEEQFYAYKETVLNAIREVEDVLAKNFYQEKKIDSINDQITISRSSLRQAQRSYTSGNASYINVLDGLLNVQSLERQLVQSRRDLALYRVELYRSIGLSGWTDEVVEGQGT